MSKALLLKWFNTNVRSFVVNLLIVVGLAGIEVLDTQATDSTFNWGVVGGAAVAAGIKFLHSALSRAAITKELGSN